MDLPSHGPEPARSIPALAKRPLIDTIFIGVHGLRAGWRLVVYAFFVVLLGFAGGVVLIPNQKRLGGAASALTVFAQEAFGFGVVFGAALIMSRIEKRPTGAYGLPLRAAFGKRFWQGWLLGLVEVCALIGLIAAFGGYSFGGLALHGPMIARWAVTWAVIFVFVGFFEEFLFRGYVQYTLGDGIGFWPAAVLLSLGFGSVHLQNPGEGPVGAASVVMIGLVFALTLKRTGSLWFAVGWHASFDFGETFLFSVPNSGIVFDGHLSSSSLHGATWLTGGTVGPEGSVFSFLTMAIIAVALHYALPPRKEAVATS